MQTVNANIQALKQVKVNEGSAAVQRASDNSEEYRREFIQQVHQQMHDGERELNHRQVDQE